MRILLDCRFAVKHAGHGRYTREFAPEILQRYSDVTWYLLIDHEDTLSWLPKHSCKIIRTKLRHYSLLEQIVLPFVLLRHGIFYVWSFHFNVPLLACAKIIATIHDVILHDYPNYQSKMRHVFYKLLFSFALLRATRIIAVSQSTKSELNKRFSFLKNDKIIVVTEGINTNLYPARTADVYNLFKKFNIQTPYYLYVGNTKEHKNVPTLIAAFLSVAAANETLVLATKDKALQTLFKNERNIHFVYDVSDYDLACLYTGAFAFITATLAEGFCLPVLEARACKTPILASNIPAILELADSNDTITFTPTMNDISQAIIISRSFSFLPSKYKLLSWKEVAGTLPTLKQLYG